MPEPGSFNFPDPDAQADPRALPQQNVPQLNVAEDPTIGDVGAQQIGLPEGTTVQNTNNCRANSTRRYRTTVSVNVPTTMATTTMVNQPTIHDCKFNGCSNCYR